MAHRSLVGHFAELPDSRIDRTMQHRLDGILVIALCGMLSGVTSFED